MEEPRSEIFKKLEDAVEQWGAQVSDAQQGLAGQLQRAAGQLEAAAGELPSAGSLSALIEEFRAELASLRALLEERTASPGGIDDVREELRAWREEAGRPAPAAVPGELRGLVEELRREFRETVDGLRAELREGLRALHRDVIGVRDEMATPPPAEAIGGPRSEAWQEVAKLRAQLEEDSGGPAAWAGSEPTDIEREAYDKEGNRRRLGDVLVAAGLLTPEQLEGAVQQQEEAPSRRLGSILVEQGLAAEEVVARVLAGQLRTRFVRLTDENVDRQAAALVSGRMARHHVCMPVRATEDRLTLAMANPFDLIAIDDVELASQRRVETVVATATDIEAAITRTYGA